MTTFYDMSGRSLRIFLLLSACCLCRAAAGDLQAHSGGDPRRTAATSFEIVSSAAPGGTVSPAGTSIVAPGDSLVFTISADSGYFIDEVYVDSAYVGYDSVYTFRDVQSDHALSVTFNRVAPPPVMIFPLDGDTVSISGPGTILLMRWHPSVDPDAGDTVWYPFCERTPTSSLFCFGLPFPGMLDTVRALSVSTSGEYEFRVFATDRRHGTHPPSIVRFHVELLTSVTEPGKDLPSAFGLDQNFPNPFNPSTVIRYRLRAAGRVTIAVYSLLGERVGTLIDAEQLPGDHQLEWNAADLPAGVYFCHMTASDGHRSYTDLRKLLLVK